MAKRTETARKRSETAEQKRAYVSQGQIPSRTLREALTVARAIRDNFGGDPTPPHQIAMALGIAPTSSNWDRLSGAAVAYGITDGASKSDKIALTPLGRRATAPTEEGDDIRALAEAAVKPAVCRAFFEKYDKNKFPPDHIATNVLHETLGVPVERAAAVLEILKDNGTFVGFIHNAKTGPFVALSDLQPAPVAIPSDGKPDLESDAESQEAIPESLVPVGPARRPPSTGFRVFISHSKNLSVVDQVKDVLALYDIDYEVAVEEETTAIPVPQKILASMRRCQAAVMVVTADEQNKTETGFAINTNVLIEIGSAFVLYDQKVVLLWDRRLKVPSNIQGLYRCEFEGSELSFAVGTKLAKALKSFRQPVN